MESDLGKLFIGGISWDTDEERLKEYFSKYGEVVEAVIMRDRVTGRARGFGFVVFADPIVAERVIMEKHVVDGRTYSVLKSGRERMILVSYCYNEMLKQKKAVPRDDQHILSRNTSSIHGPGRTKKIFVGGLASTVTENDFKKYFEQYGIITDVVVMYDHNTLRPRGFGFITYDSEEAVDRVLHKTFHELNGKMVEVKRAVPKELSPGPSRSPLMGYNYGPTNFLNAYAQGYNMSSIGGFGMRMDSRFNPLATGRSGFAPFSNTGYGMSINLEPALSPSYGGGSNFGNTPAYGRISMDRIGALLLYQLKAEEVLLAILLAAWVMGVVTTIMLVGYEGSYGDLYRSGSVYGDSTWQSATPELDGCGSFGYGLGDVASDVTTKSSEGTIWK
ncbi:hypothetical protein NC653_001740 [Populus alba x Populus x berolinensis]|uniref:RRM domain-containing protein n=1 Tax=Populus alba x Populus x berolinensis TaxID=444605 RepID=A0AAD6RMA1_9ROSI|nr:hypothetical protein NC653_001740 [Populus alba x Populus x berolinensis]